MSAATSPAPAPPRLLVFVVVDQLRADLLDRYDGLFDGGLRRLRDDGLRFTSATHNHSVTETSPGHATLSTGTHPARHGMVANQWFEQVEGAWRSVLNVEHESYTLTGDSVAGAAAPDRLMRTGFADWLLEAQPEARVVSLAGKARAAVLLAGKSHGDVFWFDERSGRFATSTFYGDSLPKWVTEFNDDEIPGFLADSLWESTVPSAAAPLTRPDTATGEGDGVHTWLPHNASAEGYSPSSGYWLANIPTLDRATLGLARVAVEAQELGSDAVPDYLALGLSAVDRVGHAYGPRSREQLDNLLRLDRELGAFFEYLDERVGVGHYAVVLSADHGVMDLPEAAEWEGRAQRLTAETRTELEESLGNVVRTEGPRDRASIARSLATEVNAFPWVRAAWPIEELSREDLSFATDSFAALQQHSTYPGRATGALGRFGVVYQLAAATLDWNWPLGTTHGSPYYYDRHVPLVFMGPGIRSGSSAKPVASIDVAPTLASWLEVAAPPDLDGRPIPLR